MSRIAINPPPADKCCMHCGKHIDQLAPFGGAGDPLVGDFTGAKLVKTFRGMCPTMPEYEEILGRIFVSGEEDNHLAEIEAEVGVERVEAAMLYDQVHNTVSASWECRDCIILDYDA